MKHPFRDESPGLEVEILGESDVAGDGGEGNEGLEHDEAGLGEGLLAGREEGEGALKEGGCGVGVALFEEDEAKVVEGGGGVEGGRAALFVVDGEGFSEEGFGFGGAVGLAEDAGPIVEDDGAAEVLFAEGGLEVVGGLGVKFGGGVEVGFSPSVFGAVLEEGAEGGMIGAEGLEDMVSGLEEEGLGFVETALGGEDEADVVKGPGEGRVVRVGDGFAEEVGVAGGEGFAVGGAGFGKLLFEFAEGGLVFAGLGFEGVNLVAEMAGFDVLLFAGEREFGVEVFEGFLKGGLPVGLFAEGEGEAFALGEEVFPIGEFGGTGFGGGGDAGAEIADDAVEVPDLVGEFVHFVGRGAGCSEESAGEDDEDESAGEKGMAGAGGIFPVNHEGSPEMARPMVFWACS